MSLKLKEYKVYFFVFDLVSWCVRNLDNLYWKSFSCDGCVGKNVCLNNQDRRVSKGWKDLNFDILRNKTIWMLLILSIKYKTYGSTLFSLVYSPVIDGIGDCIGLVQECLSIIEDLK